MVGTISNFFTSINLFELQNILVTNSYYDILFPFLLVFALMHTALGKVKIFKNKDGYTSKSVILVISLVISFYAVTFETSPGQTIGKLMMMLFPNISALTMGILSLYIVGSILGKNFFKGLFDKKHSSFVYMAVV